MQPRDVVTERGYADVRNDHGQGVELTFETMRPRHGRSHLLLFNGLRTLCGVEVTLAWESPVDGSKVCERCVRVAES